MKGEKREAEKRRDVKRQKIKDVRGAKDERRQEKTKSKQEETKKRLQTGRKILEKNNKRRGVKEKTHKEDAGNKNSRFQCWSA